MHRLKLGSIAGGRASLIYALAVLLLLILYVGLFTIQVAKNPLRLDEVDYFRSMHNVVSLGVPVYYSGEVNLDKNLLLPLSTRQLAGQEFKFYRYKPETGKLKETFIALVEPSSQYIYGMWHPPLYIYLGAFFMRFFPLTPDDSSWLRYFNLLFAIGIFGGMAGLARELDRNKWRQIFLIALVLFVSSSLAVRGSLLIDYNGTLGPCVAVWTAVAYLRSEHDRRWHWGLVFMTVLVWFTGLGIAVSLLLGLFVYWLFWGRHQRSAWYPIASVALGTAIFFPVFLAFCRVLNLPFSQPFLHNLSRAGTTWNLDWAIKMLGDAWQYIGVYTQAIGVVAIGFATVLWVRMVLTRGDRTSPARALLPMIFITGLLTQASLGANAWGFMKYILFLLPLLYTYIAYEVSSTFTSPRLPWRVFAIAAVLVVVLANSVDLYQAMREPGGTLYNSGQQGIVEAADRLRTLSDATQVVLSEKDVAFYADRKFIEWFGPRFADVAYVRQLVEGQDIQWIAVSTQALESVSPEVKAYLADTFVENYRMDDFVVLKRSTQVTPPGEG